MLKQINISELSSLKVSCEKLLLIECFSKTSTGSFLVELSLNEILEDHSELIETFKIDVDDNKNIIQEYNLYSFPALLFFENGNLIEIIHGPTTKSVILSKIEKITKKLT